MKTKEVSKDANRDPITGEPGAHPVGVGLGTVAGGAVAGAAAGALGGPIGAAVGAVVGGVAGGLAGKGVAEAVDPTAEDAYWRDKFNTRPYYQAGDKYDTYRPAYQFGRESYARHDRAFEDVEPSLRTDWSKRPDVTVLPWEKAKPAVQDSFERARKIKLQNTITR